ncbi:MAG: hypothetical protein GX446_16190 [Chthonomonadales bacterium]|nr:hypothetical protein [Chthonomonadales bacterium]
MTKPWILWRVGVFAAAALGASAPLAYRTTWIGNSFGGGPRWVQNFIEGMAVAPDGTVVCASTWDEAGREYGIYRDGDVVGMCADTHGWGELGGSAVAIGSRYLFIAMVHGNEGGHLTGDAYPPKGLAWFCISRRKLNGDHAPFTHGRGRFGDQLVLHEAPETMEAHIRGLATDGKGRLYVSDPVSARIRVFEEETMQEQASFSVLRSRQLAVGPDGSLWALHAPDAGAPASELLKPERDDVQWRVVRYAPDGRELATIWLPKRSAPTALAFDRRGRLLIADNGPDQQIRVYASPNGGGRFVGALGVKGGVYARPNPGTVAPDRLIGPTGLGCDAAGNLYVGGNTPAGGSVLRCYEPAEPSQPLRLRWELLGLEFVDGADVDRGDGTDGRHVYTAEGHYEADWDRPPGKQWTWRGFSLDPFRYPDDLRLLEGHHGLCGALVRRIGGRRFLVVRGMFQHFLVIYRYDREIAIPSVMFSRGHYRDGAWMPPGQPPRGAWMWRDSDGDGQMEAGEYLDVTADNEPEFWAWWMDEKGGVWRGDQTGERPIRHYPVQGLDRRGNPIYSREMSRTFPMPPPMNHLLRIEYDPATDAMLLGGHTVDRPKTGDEWGQVGAELLRYDGWLRGEPKLRWRIPLPYDPANGVTVKSMCAESDAVFAVECRSARVHVFDRATGAKLGEMTPGPEVHRESGWVDFPDAIRAYRRRDGEYLVFVEEDWKGKIIVYRWQQTR